MKIEQEDLQHDPALAATLKLDRFYRREVVIWFIQCLLAAVAAGISISYHNTIATHDVKRQYAPTGTDYRLLDRSNKAAPIPDLDTEELGKWLERSVIKCMTFDYQSYADVADKCSSEAMSLNKDPATQQARGRLFFASLEESGLITTLLDAKTSMTILVEDVEYIDADLQNYHYSYMDNMEIVSKSESIYVYEYEMTFRIKMEGQKLDAPIRYQVLVERMSHLVRESGLGIRSILSIE